MYIGYGQVNQFRVILLEERQTEREREREKEVEGEDLEPSPERVH